FGGREAPSERDLRQFGRILSLVFGGATPVAERCVRAIGVRIVPDIEVRPELRGGHVESATDEAVTSRDRNEDNREAESEHPERVQRAERPQRPQRRFFLGVVKKRPDRDDHDEDERVLAGETEATHREPEREPRKPQRPPRPQRNILLTQNSLSSPRI